MIEDGLIRGEGSADDARTLANWRRSLWRVTPPAQEEQPAEEGISRNDWKAAAIRVFIAAGDTEKEARELAAYLCDQQDWLSDEVQDPYEAALDDLDGRNAGAARAAGSDVQPEVVSLRFPVELRKMWSGSEVQAWLDRLPPMVAAPGLQRRAKK